MILSEEVVSWIADALKAVLQNKQITPLEAECESAEVQEIALLVGRIGEAVREMNGFVIELSKGNLNADPPPRTNFLASGAKQLHMHLNHLTWQTQQIAKGDYSQKIDFMGDFSKAFNIMIDQLREREMVLKQSAETDALTGLCNRRTLETTLTREWRIAITNRIEIAALMLDIDYFKRYNDTYGHLQGDVCLRAVAGCLNDSCRRASDLAVRYGGEEFLVVLQNTSLANAVKMAEKIRLQVEKLEIPLTADPEEKTRVTVSVGVASLVPTPSQTSSMLLDMADQALYQSKKEGRNRVTVNGAV